MHFAWKYLPALGVYIYKYMHLYIIHASVYIDVYPETTKRWLKTMSRDIFILMIEVPEVTALGLWKFRA